MQFVIRPSEDTALIIPHPHTDESIDDIRYMYMVRLDIQNVSFMLCKVMLNAVLQQAIDHITDT